ncbi:MAG: DUF262 domain-containing protein [Symploca sp. SIO2E6]|nr:DUF262 domain-containing protein [Symploca sp. SIO2E6]
MTLAPVEKKMWEISPSQLYSQRTDREIDAKYEKGEKRILTETNRERLPSFVESLNNPNYMEIRPYFQRRSRWDEQKQSRLIESFLINILVPPILLYEKAYNCYEVMDGQQRITAIKRFYENELKLTGLELWPELNGKFYKDLPPNIKAGIDRRSISSVTLITESTSDPEEAFYLKQIAFERINTGGVKLSRQEARNCLFYNEFNQLLFELSANPIFAKALGIYLNDEEERNQHQWYKTMEDVELVLRFFALRNVEHFTGKLETFLDNYMKKSHDFSAEDIEFLRNEFVQTIELVDKIYEDNLFTPFNAKKRIPYKAYYDAVMVGFSNYLSSAELLIEKKSQIIEATKDLLRQKNAGLFTGQGKTKDDLKMRIQLFSDMLKQVIND